MEIDLTGVSVLVTGASSGIGEAIARSLGRSRATVAVHYNTRADRAFELAAQIGNNAQCFQADLSDHTQAAGLFDSVRDALGAIDVLVNNAGIFPRSPLDLDVDDWLGEWNRTMAVNATAAGLLCYKAIHHFLERGGGRMIHIASRAAFRGETGDHLAYAASKGALVSLSRSIARSFGGYNVKSFVIAPGWVRTPMTEDFLAVHEREILEKEQALGEITKPEDIAPLVTFIASGMMDHATGTVVDVNAGSYMR
jgi:NAD(P)-dependent dehydrogenase (short-subunit alcohol dehydrogenase family)